MARNTTQERPYSIPVYRVKLVRERCLKFGRDTVTSSSDAASLIRSYLGLTDRENMVVVMLDVKLQVIGINTVSIGSLDSAVVHPREVFKPAILSNAHRIILGHNHPSGDPRPSDEDKRLTLQLADAGRLMDIAVEDHIIVALDGAYYSFRNDGTELD